MRRYLLILALLIPYISFAQRPYEIRGAGYWPIEHPIEKYWLVKPINIKISEVTDLEINNMFFCMDYENNKGYYYSLTSIIDGTKVSAIYLIIDFIFGL